MVRKVAALEFAERCIDDPVFFAEHVCGFDPWGVQRDILHSIRDNRKTIVKACHSSGKTSVCAVGVLWFLVTHVPSIVFTSAPNAQSVNALLFGEIRTRVEASRSRVPIPGTTYKVARHEIAHNHYAVGYTSADTSGFQGLHAPNIMGVLDEASGVESWVWEAARANLASGFSRFVAIGNPLDPTSAFYDEFHTPGVTGITISAYDTPNFTETGITEDDIASGAWEGKAKRLVRPYLITPTYVAEEYARYGADSSLYKARILGEFPNDSEDALVPWSAIERAERRWQEYRDEGDTAKVRPEGRVEIGVDVADSGKDFSVRVIRQGGYVLQIRANPYDEAVGTAGRVINDLREFQRFSPIARIDNIGVGAPAATLILSEGFPVARINGQGAPAHKRIGQAECLNARAEAYWTLRQAFIDDRIAIPEDPYLRQELAATRYVFSGSGKIQIIKKDEIKKAIGRSPDRADALAYSFSPVGTYGTADPDAVLTMDPEPAEQRLEYTHENLLALLDGRMPWA